MPINTLPLNPATPQALASLMLGEGTEKNTGSLVFTNTLNIEVEDGSFPNVGLPTIWPGCDWADVTVDVAGCVFSPYTTQPASIVAIVWTSEGGVQTVGPYAPVAGPGVTVNALAMAVGMPPFGLILPHAPGSMDLTGQKGNRYQLTVTVKPHAGEIGLRKWEFTLSTGHRCAVVVNLIPPDAQESPKE